MNSYIKKFSEISMADIEKVGGKYSYLGSMFLKLLSSTKSAPNGFAITTFAFEEFLAYNSLHSGLYDLIVKFKKNSLTLKEAGLQARNLLLDAKFPEKLQTAITESYKELCSDNYLDVNVHSSILVTDLQLLDILEQSGSFSYIRDDDVLLRVVKKCFASIYSDEAIQYREATGYIHIKTALSIGVQKIQSHTILSELFFKPHTEIW